MSAGAGPYHAATLYGPVNRYKCCGLFAHTIQMPGQVCSALHRPKAPISALWQPIAQPNEPQVAALPLTVQPGCPEHLWAACSRAKGPHSAPCAVVSPPVQRPGADPAQRPHDPGWTAPQRARAPGDAAAPPGTVRCPREAPRRPDRPPPGQKSWPLQWGCPYQSSAAEAPGAFPLPMHTWARWSTWGPHGSHMGHGTHQTWQDAPS